MSEQSSRPVAFDHRRSESYERRAVRLLHGLYRHVAADAAALAPDGGAVLDVGTGPGRLLHELAARRTDVSLHGTDISPDMLRIAERAAAAGGLAGRLALCTGDVTALPHQDAGYDLVVSTLSMHEWPDLAAAARELARVLRPGGRLLIYDFRFGPVRAARAALAAQPAFAGRGVSRRSVRPGWWPVPLFTRLTATAAPG